VLYLIVALILVSTATILYSGLSMVFSEGRQVSRRLARLSDYERAQAGDIEPLLKPFTERVLGPFSQGLKRVGRQIVPLGYREDVRRRLTMAGQPRGMDAERFTALKIVGPASVVLFFGGMHLIVGLGLASWLLVVLPLAIGTFLLPDVWLSRRITDRKTAIRRALPDMLDMLTISVEAGLGFDQAVAKLVKNTRNPLAEEFGRMLQEVQAGVSRRDALRALSERAGVTELNAFIMSIVQADVFGISVGKILRTQAVEMRTKRRQLAEEQAAKAPVKLVFPLVLCILPATLLVILGPAVISIARVILGM